MAAPRRGEAPTTRRHIEIETEPRRDRDGAGRSRDGAGDHIIEILADLRASYRARPTADKLMALQRRHVTSDRHRLGCQQRSPVQGEVYE